MCRETMKRGRIAAECSAGLTIRAKRWNCWIARVVPELLSRISPLQVASVVKDVARWSRGRCSRSLRSTRNIFQRARTLGVHGSVTETAIGLNDNTPGVPLFLFPPPRLHVAHGPAIYHCNARGKQANARWIRSAVDIRVSTWFIIARVLRFISRVVGTGRVPFRIAPEAKIGSIVPRNARLSRAFRESWNETRSEDVSWTVVLKKRCSEDGREVGIPLRNQSVN